MREKTTGTIAIVVRMEDETPVLIDAISDDSEIVWLERAISEGTGDPLRDVYEKRATQRLEDEEFANYVEDLLSQPFLDPKIQEHGVQWFKARHRIEVHEQNERDAKAGIVQYAMEIFADNKSLTEFELNGNESKVRVKIHVLERDKQAA